MVTHAPLATPQRSETQTQNNAYLYSGPFTQSALETLYCNLFGASRSLVPELVYGLHRKHDETVAHEVDRLLHMKPQLDLLSLAAGTSYSAFSPHYGAPYIERRLATHYGDRIRVTASDVTQGGAHLFALKADGSLIAAARPYRYQVPKELSLELVRIGNAAMFIPVTARTLMSLCARPLRSAVADSLAVFRMEHGLEESESTLLFLRPQMDTALEKGVFNLHMEAEVDYLRLHQHFDDNTFDIIIARNLIPAHIDYLKKITYAIQRCLRDDGVGVLGIDGRAALKIEKKRITHLDDM